MNNVVLDASAVLCLLNKERGHEKVEHALSDALISAVNVSEVMAVLLTIGMPEKEAITLLSDLLNNIIPFDKTQSFIAASLIKQTKSCGLSLGDRACLALGIAKHLPVLTCDKAWEKIEMPVKVMLVR